MWGCWDGSNAAATLLSSGTEEWSRMKKKSKGERKSESERFSIVGRNGPRIPFPFSLPKYMLEVVFLGLNNASISQCGSWPCPPSPSFAPPIHRIRFISLKCGVWQYYISLHQIASSLEISSFCHLSLGGKEHH